MAKKRINWSKRPNFDVLVNAVCNYNGRRKHCMASGTKPPSMTLFWKENVQGKGPAHLPLRTFTNYVKHRKLGTQAGPRSDASKHLQEYRQWQQRQKQMEIDTMVNQLLCNQWHFWHDSTSMIPMGAVVNNTCRQEPQQQQQLPKQQQQQEARARGSRLEEEYKKLSLSFKNQPRRSPTEKKAWQDYCRWTLPQICDAVGGDKSFLEEELELLRQCGRTCGSAEVSYVEPGCNEIGKAGGRQTKKRRERLEKKIDHFQRIKTRHSLLLQGGAAGRSALMVATDYLLKRFDQDLVAYGLEPSDLRERLREYNHMCTKELKEIGDRIMNRAESDNDSLGVRDLDISTEEAALFQRQILNEMVHEDDDISVCSEDTSPANIWEQRWSLDNNTA